MPLDKKVFLTRTLSAIVFAVVMVAGIVYSPWTFLALFAVVHAGCWWEYLRLQEKIHDNTLNFLLKSGFILTGFAWYLAFAGWIFTYNGYALKQSLTLPFLLAGFVLLAAGLLQRSQHVHTRQLLESALGLVYISLSLGMLLSLRQEVIAFPGDTENYLDFGWIYPMFLIASIWISDTMAYITGSLIGKTPLTRISPKKTIEGTLGGILLSIILMTAIAWYADLHLPVSIALAVVGSAIGTLGDILESWLKRRAGVKDSGKIMPGHGGFLDRFDSLLLAAPFAWIVVKLLG